MPQEVLDIVVLILVAFMAFKVLRAVFGGPNAEERARVRELLDEGDAELIDVRTPQEFAQNGLDGARNIPVQAMGQRLDDVGAKEKPVVVYCQSGMRSARAARILQKAGFEEVYDLGGRSKARKVVEGEG